MSDTHTEVYVRYGEILRAAGYDVAISDVVVGRLDRGDYVREVVVDRGGRFSLAVTRMLAPARGRRITRGQWQFRTLLGQQQSTRIACELGEPAELAGALAEAELLAGALPDELDKAD